MSKHLKRFLIASAWAGLTIVVIGAVGCLNVLVFIGFGLIAGFISLALWCKAHKPAWYNELK